MNYRQQNEAIKSRAVKPANVARSGVRINAELHDAARQAAEVSARTVPAQVEYWMKIGQLFDGDVLNAQQIFDLFQGKTFVESVSIKENKAIATDDVFATLDADRESGALAKQIPAAAPVYDIDTKRSGAIRRVNADGSTEYGQFIEGRFVPDH